MDYRLLRTLDGSHTRWVGKGGGLGARNVLLGRISLSLGKTRWSDTTQNSTRLRYFLQYFCKSGRGRCGDYLIGVAHPLVCQIEGLISIPREKDQRTEDLINSWKIVNPKHRIFPIGKTSRDIDDVEAFFVQWRREKSGRSHHASQWDRLAKFVNALAVFLVTNEAAWNLPVPIKMSNAGQKTFVPVNQVCRVKSNQVLPWAKGLGSTNAVN